MNSWNKLDKSCQPEIDIIDEYVDNPLWNDLRDYIEETYQVVPSLEYSGCGMQPGWNVKYKKAGRSLCTLYPMEGYYIALVVIGNREWEETEMLLSTFTEYTQKLYHETQTGMGQRWLMIQVKDASILEDVKRLIAIRHGKTKRQINVKQKN